MHLAQLFNARSRAIHCYSVSISYESRVGRSMEQARLTSVTDFLTTAPEGLFCVTLKNLYILTLSFRSSSACLAFTKLNRVSL